MRCDCMKKHMINGDNVLSSNINYIFFLPNVNIFTRMLKHVNVLENKRYKI